MRYSLRNKEKIAKAYSPAILDRIIKSLDAHFRTSTKIEGIKQEGEKYPLLIIDDSGHTTNLIAFYIVGGVFDVVNLAFKEFIG